MPSLRPAPKTTRVELPSGAWVDVKEFLQLGDIAAIAQSGSDNMILAGLSRMVTAWNLTVDDTPDSPIAPINVETINQLDPDDFPVLADAFGKLYAESKNSEVSGEEKKALSDSSSTTSPVETNPNQPTTIPIG